MSKMELFETMMPVSQKEVILTKDLFEMDRASMKQEILNVAKSAASVGVGILLSILFLSINMHFAGHLEVKEIMPGLGLGNVMLNCSGYFLVIGLNQGFGSMSSRAYSSGLHHLQMNYYSKALLMNAIVSACVFLFMFVLEDVLLALGQEPLVSFYAAQYANGIIFGMICLFFFDCIRNFYNSMGYYTEPMLIQFVSIVLQYVFCHTFCVTMGYGFKGIIFATNLNYSLLLVMAIIFGKYKGIDLKPDFQLNIVLKNYQKFIMYCIPFALPMVIDTFGFELNSILIGSLQISHQFAAHMIICNLASLLFSFPLGLCGALSNMISHAVGKNDHVAAKNFFKISYFVGIGFGLCSTTTFLLFKEPIGRLYSNNDQVIDSFLTVMSFFQFVLCIDYLQGSQQGVLKGVGLGKVCLYLFIVSFYFVGTTASCILGFTFQLELTGFWIGFVIAILTVFTLQTLAILRIKWPEKVQEQFNHLLDDKKILEALQSGLPTD